jgi:uncharacterized membrane protein YphA (DoxX/SURF4 family)
MKVNLIERFIGLVFLLSGLHRIFLKNRREYEAYNLLRLPVFSDIIIIFIEVICGFIILFNLSQKYYALIIITIMSTIGTLLLIINNYDDIIKSYNDLFTLHKNSLSVCLHVTYIVILLYLLSSYKHRPIVV